jgi:hypothetical protein
MKTVIQIETRTTNKKYINFILQSKLSVNTELIWLRIGECPSNSPLLKIMEPRPQRGQGPLFLRNGEIRGHSPT